MGVSFKVSKTGTRYRPKSLSPPSHILPPDFPNEVSPISESIAPKQTQAPCVGIVDDVTDVSVPSAHSRKHLLSLENEVSFSLNLFPNGFSIGKPAEGMLLPLLQDVPKLLHPYDRASETLFSAVESGWLPGDILDDIPCKYINGTIVCEVWDYRNCMPKSGSDISSGNKFPIVQKVRLRMCTENVVKDMSSISDDSWTYSDLLEVESRILKAMQPELCLDPIPLLDRLCRTTGSKKNISRTGVIKNPRSHARLVVDGSVPSCAMHISNIQQNKFGPEVLRHGPPMASDPNYQSTVNCSRLVPATPVIPEQDLIDSYSDPRNPSTSVRKRDICEAQLSPKSTMFKKPKQEQLDLVQQQLNGGQVGAIGADLQWKNNMLPLRLEAGRVQRARFAGPKHPQALTNDSQQAVLEGDLKLDTGTPSYLDPRGPQYCVKDELIETTKLEKPQVENIAGHQTMGIRSDQSNHLQRQSPLVRAQFPPPIQLYNPGLPVEKDMKRDDASQKRKSAQSPWVSSVGPTQSLVAPTRSGKISSFSLGAPYSTSQSASAIGSHKEKAASVSGAALGTASVNSGHNDSLRENQASLSTKRKSNSLPKTPSMSGVGSPVSVSNVNAPFNANSPPVGTSSVPLPSGSKGDPVLSRFFKIEMLTQRYRLNYKDCKVNESPERKPFLHDPQLLAFQLSQSEDTDGSRDTINTMPMSKSLIGGSINACKTRVLSFIRPRRAYQGNGMSVIVRESQCKLVMSEHPKDHLVEAQIIYKGEEESDVFAISQYDLPKLPNTHYADLLAAQFASLMVRNRYQLTNDQVQPYSTCNDGASSNQPAFPGEPWGRPPELPYPTAISGQSMNAVNPMSSSISTQSLQQFSPQNIVAGVRMLSRNNLHALQMSSSYLSRPLQLDSAVQLAAMHKQQHPHIQRSLPLVGNNLLGSSTNLQMGNQVVSSQAHLQFQLQQRQSQLHQQRKMMVAGLGPTVGAGNMGMMQSMGSSQGLGNMVGLGSTSNVVGMGGLGGSMSASMGGHVPGLSNLGQISNLNRVSSIGNLSQQLRAGGISHAQAVTLAKMQLQQPRGRGMLSGGLIRNSIDGVGGMAGSGIMHGGSMSMNQTLGRGGMPHSQHGDMVSMGFPKFPSTNPFMNNQQQQLQELQQTGSPMSPQVSGLPEQVGSPMVHTSSQQMGQQVPMSPQQLCSGAGSQQQMNAGSGWVGPGSPQLSSQTHGSVGSITSSPMELQGVAKVGATVSNGVVGGE
ncbi:protein PHYTOCHROME-DEPENDENT LATE-FLOWERING-like isoform X2 [Magnolia sinica]|uniref:protein PHYTOCHROME-DEPENDENT LATE-FLOWERING-like isoform X2 n=1 Tax=Magnolia sinica TaxID=86752 RepID=UPI0026580F72|nr:protein PHYTOCHROME-DEPENDENT LATE-FLOWERING-like isoform X2 [Magnolia sinica]